MGMKGCPQSTVMAVSIHDGLATDSTPELALEGRWTGHWTIAHLGEKGNVQLNGVKRKVHNSQIKPYLSRKRQLSECDSEARDAQGDAHVKLRRRPESSATTNNAIDDNNKDGNLWITGFVTHAESMDYKSPGT